MNPGKTVWFVFATLVVVGLYIWVASSLTKSQTYYSPTGTLEFESSGDLYIGTSGDVVLKAVSIGYFHLKNGKKGVISALLQTEKPLGWPYDDLYAFGPENVPAGTWDLQDGGAITYLLKSNSSIEVIAKANEEKKFNVWFLGFMMALIIWLCVAVYPVAD